MWTILFPVIGDVTRRMRNGQNTYWQCDQIEPFIHNSGTDNCRMLRIVM